MENKTYLVKNCASCPFNNYHGQTFLMGPDGPPECKKANREIKNEEIVPKWCPLKKGPSIEHKITTIQLLNKQS